MNCAKNINPKVFLSHVKHRENPAITNSEVSKIANERTDIAASRILNRNFVAIGPCSWKDQLERYHRSSVEHGILKTVL